MGVKFESPLSSRSVLRPFDYRCSKVLPTVYDDTLSHYENLNKIVKYLNECIEYVTSVGVDISQLHDAYVLLQQYVNDTFNTGELADARRGVNDVVYESLGKAIREQIKMVHIDALDAIASINDARRGYDDTEYDDLGEAIRQQFLKAFSSIEEIVAEISNAKTGAGDEEYGSLGDAIREQISMAHDSALQAHNMLQQAQVDANGKEYGSLSERLNTEFNNIEVSVDNKLKEIRDEIGGSGVDTNFGVPFAVQGDGSIKVEFATDYNITTLRVIGYDEGFDGETGLPICPGSGGSIEVTFVFNFIPDEPIYLEVNLDDGLHGDGVLFDEIDFGRGVIIRRCIENSETPLPTDVVALFNSLPPFNNGNATISVNDNAKLVAKYSADIKAYIDSKIGA